MSTFKSATPGCLFWTPRAFVSASRLLLVCLPNDWAGTRFKYSLPQAPLPPPLPARDIEPLPFALIAVVLAWGAKFSGKLSVGTTEL
jgi:hypothetical protein